MESILAAAQQLPPEELRQLIDHLLSDVSSELQADDQLRQEILEAEQQSTNYDTSIGTSHRAREAHPLYRYD